MSAPVRRTTEAGWKTLFRAMRVNGFVAALHCGKGLKGGMDKGVRVLILTPGAT
jgi:hypothetical protein